MSLGIDCCNCLRRIRLCGRLFSQSAAASRSGFHLDRHLCGRPGRLRLGNDKPNWVVESPIIFFTDTFNDSPQGVIGGAHVGYNQQFNQWVIGVEGSVDGTSLSKTGRGVPRRLRRRQHGRGDIAIQPARIDPRPRRHWLGTHPVYGTGGVAFAGVKNEFVDTIGTFTGIPGSTASFSNTRVGWTAGGGLEYALTNNWTLRAEYRFSQFGNHSFYPFSAAIFPSLTFNAQQHFTESQAQVGFSYKFDSWLPAPVVANIPRLIEEPGEISCGF